MELSGYAFGRVCEIEPDRTDAGAIRIAVPQPEYAKRDEKAVHDHGWGPFCAFGVPDDGTRRPGVYAIAVEDEVAYVGETQDLYAKFANGYGNISPADCFEGGGGTNCRLNTAIFRAVRAGDRVSLHLHATDDFAGSDEENRALRRIIKDDLVTAVDPAWNRTGGNGENGERADADREDGAETPSSQPDAFESEPNEPVHEAFEPEATEPEAFESATTEPRGFEGEGVDDDGFERKAFEGEGLEIEGFESAVGREATDAEGGSQRERSASAGAPESGATTDAESPAGRPTGEFAALYDYLADHERDRVERSFAELEVVLEAELPTEARRWRRWWTNDESSHPHAGAWLRAGYEVTDVSFPEGRVAFRRRSADESPTGSAESESPPFGRAAPRRRE